MLTSELIRPRLRMHGSTLHVEMVHEQDPSLQQTAQDLISLFHHHRGQSQAAWEEAVRAYEGTGVDYVLIRGLAKVLADAATFTPLSTPLPPATLRERVFEYGPVFGTPDLFHARTPAGLLARYNLELARGALYWASHITIEVASNYKDLWKYIKLFKLMFWAEPKRGGGYRIDLDGPISPFVSSTLRYGRQLAAFLPALFLCDQWRMHAYVHPPQGRGEMLYRLDHTCSLHSHFKRSGEFDSRLEADFAREFEQKVGDKRGHWHLTRESEVLLLGDTVMVPDFVLTDTGDANRRILVELVGFWHPNYLRRKVEKVRAAQCAHLLLLVYHGLNVTEEAFQDVASEVIFFQHKPVLKEVMETVETMAERVYGPRRTSEHTSKKRRRPTRSGAGNAPRASTAVFLSEG